MVNNERINLVHQINQIREITNKEWISNLEERKLKELEFHNRDRDQNFLREAKVRGNKTMNGKMMFLWQAHLAFKMWTGVSPKIDDEVIKLLD